ncbi:hypothetical protein GCM10009609_73730 [Pseudonocardia aurantiaca]|uniref:Uncharacterized protein n=1 Tax=Pseudonocardia aurantiaca TaxID=75290 RepID=A0ABW4FIY8_9PSEU
MLLLPLYLQLVRGESALQTGLLLARIQPRLAAAFGAKFWWAVGFVGIAFVVTFVLLPKRKPAPWRKMGRRPRLRRPA